MGEYYEVAPFLEELFNDAESVMTQLSANNGIFTFKQFLQTVTQRKQTTYIEMLQECTKHPSASPFNATHQHIGNTLSRRAKKAGYTRRIEGQVPDIFGNDTDNVIYRKT